MDKINTFAFDDYEDYSEYPELLFAIDSNRELNDLIDKIRQEKGYMPFYSDSIEIEYWYDGWYNFYLTINNETETVIKFEAVVVGNLAYNDDTKYVPDNEKIYDITDYIDKDKCVEWLRENKIFIDAKEWYEQHKKEEAI